MTGEIKSKYDSETRKKNKLDRHQSGDSAEVSTEKHKRSKKKRKLSVTSETELECRVKGELGSDGRSHEERAALKAEHGTSGEISLKKLDRHQSGDSAEVSTEKHKRSKKKRKLSVTSETELECRVKGELGSDGRSHEERAALKAEHGTSGEISLKKLDRHQSGDSAEVSTEKHKRSKKKRKLSVTSETELECRVKGELGSDGRSHEERAADDDSYLELRVKQEHSPPPYTPDTHKKKKKRKRTFTDQPPSDNDQSASSCKQTELKQSTDKISDESESSKVSKKKKHKKKKKLKNEMDVEDEFSAAETAIQSPPRNGCSHHSRSVDGDQSQRSDDLEETAPKISANEHSDTKLSDRDKRNRGNKVSRSKSMVVDSSTSVGASRKLRMSEAIPSDILSLREGFEDDIDENFHPESSFRPAPSQSTEQTDGLTVNRLVNEYIKAENLRSVETSIPGSLIDEDDDVWMIKTPSELTCAALRGLELPAEGKGKIKVAGITYESSSEGQAGHVDVAMCRDGKYVIQRVPLRGVVQLRWRVPKTHVKQEPPPARPQRIPLPATKRRHPLFGAQYEDALTLPHSVACRLREAVDAVDADDRTKKKKKRKREAAEAAEAGEGSEGRERSEAPPRKRKKAKRSSPAAAAWESAQDIEHNLFN